MSLLTQAQFRDRTTMPKADVDVVESIEAGYILNRLKFHTSRINSRLRKRYATPFAADGAGPELALGWLTDIVTPEVWLKRGVNPEDPQYVAADRMRDLAFADLKEAADSDEGLFELPLRESTEGASGVTRGGPFGYAEASPYSAMDVQAEIVRGGGR